MGRAPQRLLHRLTFIVSGIFLAPAAALALAPANPPQAPPEASLGGAQPNWDLRLGLSFLATGGNSRTRSLGFDATYDHDWSRWGLSSGATAVNNSDHGTTSAERYSAFVRGTRTIAPHLDLSAGLQGERDRFAGIDLRTVADLSLEEKWLATDRMALSTLTGFTWTSEKAIEGVTHRDFGGLIGAQGKLALASTSSVTVEITYFPDFTRARAYRLESKAALEASVTSRLALRLGASYRFNHDPPSGYGTTDTTATASLVIHLGRAKKP